MTKSLESDVFSLVQCDGSSSAPPAMPELEFFRRLHLGILGLECVELLSDTPDGDFSHREKDINSSDFTGAIECTVVGSPDLLTDENTKPLGVDRVFKMNISVNSPDWGQQVALKFTRSVFGLVSCNLEGGSSRATMVDLRAVDFTLETNAPTGQDRIRVELSATNNYPDPTTAISLIVNGAAL